MGSAIDGSEGIFEEAPLKGILVWNSHAFNVTDRPAPLDMWINFDFATPPDAGGVDQQHLRAIDLQRRVDRIARGAGHGADDAALLTKQLIQQR